MTLPVIFFGHGSPMNALEKNALTLEWAKQIPKQTPRAILMISAHWYTRGTAITSNLQPETIHDFGGFPEALHQFDYPAPGSSTLAKEIAETLSPHHVMLTEDWGLDHGCWSVLTHLYPQANIPVLQLSLNANLSPQEHLALAAKLQPLRDQGVLILGSGNIVHNLRLLRWNSSHVPKWASDFLEPIKTWVHERDFAQVANYQQLGQAAELAVPHPDHFLPLLYILGASTKDDQATWFTDQYAHEGLSMASLRFDAQGASN